MPNSAALPSSSPPPPPGSPIATPISHSAHRRRPWLVGLALGAIGVVFGDIGTSPLYTLQTAVDGRGQLDRADVFGIVSLILWALTLAVSIKYVGFIMRADNGGEGGILALLALLPKKPKPNNVAIGVVPLLVLAGAALLFGDGMITPAISVLSAVEGLELASPAVKPFVVPITCALLFGLFAIQSRGTSAVGRLFGPVMVVWFSAVAVLGVVQIVLNPEILSAVSPHWGALYFARHGLRGLTILGVVVLAITGGEALYADMGHFGAPAVRLSWFGLVFPSLALGYLGQGALVLRDPSALAHPFFSMVPPGPIAYAAVALAAMATVIASQALISGVFSLTHQAVQLGFFPRVRVMHTSREAEGQIYVPLLNWALMVACIALVLAFRESDRLASAYGLAVSGTMAITSLVFFEVTRLTWRWPRAWSIAVLVLFLSFDIPFFLANLTKFADGGYVPVVVGAAFFVVMVDWHVGRSVLRRYVDAHTRSLDELRALLSSGQVTRVPGLAIYLTTTGGAPHVLATHATRMRAVMERVLLLKIEVLHQPQVDDTARRCDVEPFDEHGLARVVLRFGYMETPHVPSALRRSLEDRHVDAPLESAVYYVGHETPLAGRGGELGPLTEGLFAVLVRNARSAVDHFGLPPEQVVEIGTRVDL